MRENTVLTINDVSQRLGCKYTTLYYYVATGRIAADAVVTEGNRYLFYENSLPRVAAAMELSLRPVSDVPVKFMGVVQFALRLGVSRDRLSRLLQSGLIEADAVIDGGRYLFDERSVARIERDLKALAGPRWRRLGVSQTALARLSKIYQRSDRELRRWLNCGITNGDPCPVFTPAAMSGWWQRNMRYPAPDIFGRLTDEVVGRVLATAAA